jgi:hypothetical protein
MRFKDRFWMWIAWRLPRPLVYWASIRLLARATVKEYSGQEVPKLKALEALQRWK